MQTTLCARPGCAGAAAAWLTYDYAAQQVWLDDEPVAGAGDQWGLCADHAGRLRAPNGWAEVDRRDSRGDGRPDPSRPSTSLVS